MKCSEELVAVVDEENRVVGSATRGEMRARRLWHRATYVLVFNSRGELFVHWRSASKDLYPSWGDVAAGGVVGTGESYEAAAERELAEELGIEGVPLETHGDFCCETPENRVWGRVFSCVYDGPLTLQADEVQGGAFLAPAAVLARAQRGELFTPDGLAALRRFLSGPVAP